MLPLSLATLNSDILQSIIEIINDNRDEPVSTTPCKPCRRLLSLSRVSKRLRTECAPHLFREYRHDIWKPDTVIPKHLRRFIKVLQIQDLNVVDYETPDQVLAAKELWEALPDMNAVTTCTYERLCGPDIHFAKALSMLPSLSTLELVDTFFETTRDPGFNLITGLTRLTFHFSDWEEFAPNRRRSLSVIQREAYYLLVLLSSSASTLEYIKIPGETACPEEMSKHHWPRLRHLVLHGAVPEKPLISLLRQAPSLCILDVQCSRMANSPNFFVYPESHLNEAAILPQIRSLTLSNPSPNDRIFYYFSNAHFLPFEALSTLGLDMNGVGRLYLPIWTANEAREALLHCQMPNLVELRISVQSDDISELIQTISHTFPSLEVLELHRYPATEQTIPAQPFDIPFGLERLPCLTELKLDLNIWRDLTMSIFDRAVYHNKSALLVAETIPQLKSVSLFIRQENFAGFWKKYNLPLDITLQDVN